MIESPKSVMHGKTYEGGEANGRCDVTKEKMSGAPRVPRMGGESTYVGAAGSSLTPASHDCPMASPKTSDNQEPCASKKRKSENTPVLKHSHKGRRQEEFTMPPSGDDKSADDSHVAAVGERARRESGSNTGVSEIVVTIRVEQYTHIMINVKTDATCETIAAMMVDKNLTMSTDVEDALPWKSMAELEKWAKVETNNVVIRVQKGLHTKAYDHSVWKKLNLLENFVSGVDDDDVGDIILSFCWRTVTTE